MARNPDFDLLTPRYLTAYAESSFPLRLAGYSLLPTREELLTHDSIRFMVDGRSNDNASLDTTVARGFFQHATFPPDFYRRNGSFDFDGVGHDNAFMLSIHPIKPGRNEGLGNYVTDPDDPSINESGVSTDLSLYHFVH